MRPPGPNRNNTRRHWVNGIVEHISAPNTAQACPVCRRHAASTRLAISGRLARDTGHLGGRAPEYANEQTAMRPLARVRSLVVDAVDLWRTQTTTEEGSNEDPYHRPVGSSRRPRALDGTALHDRL